jgi:hypothetical protein
MKTVWRIENSEGTGPYHSFFGEIDPVLRKMGDNHSWSEGPNFRPTPIHEKFPNPPGLTGTKTRRHLMKWFEGYTERLKRLGFRIVKHTVREAVESTLYPEWGQRVFYRRDVLSSTKIPW